MGCLPVLLQVPVFIGLFHVLRSFNRTGTGFGQLGLTPEENASIAQLRLQRRKTSSRS